MESLSAEIIELIFGQLDVLSLVNSSRVCRQWGNYTTNWRLWQSFYFQRWPFHKDNIVYNKVWCCIIDNKLIVEQSVRAQWKSLYIRMHTYSRDILCLHELPLRKSVQRHMEEVLISPYVLNRNSLYCSTVESSYFRVMSDRLFCATEDKNELFNTFVYDLEFLSYYHQPNFTEEFSKVVTAAKTSGKKTLLLVPDLSNTHKGINPILNNPTLANEFIQTVNTCANKSPMMSQSFSPPKSKSDSKSPVPTNLFICSYAVQNSQNGDSLAHLLIILIYSRRFAWCKMNLVHVKLPDREERIELLPEFTKTKGVWEDGDFDINFNFLVDKFEGVNEDIMCEVVRRTAKKALSRALANHSTNENESMHVVITMDDFTEEFKNNIRLPWCSVWDRDIIRVLQNMANTYPEDLKLWSI